MSGIVNQTGARSGVIGDTKLVAGSIGESVTFPSGHVIKTGYHWYSSAVTITSSSKASGTSTGLDIAVQASSTSNFLYFFINLSLKMTGSASNSAYGMEVHDGSSIVYTDVTDTATWVTNTGNGDDSRRAWYHFRINPASTSNITYTMRCFKNASGQGLTAQLGGNTSYVTVMEVQA